jgi:hypothetical protein
VAGNFRHFWEVNSIVANWQKCHPQNTKVDAKNFNSWKNMLPNFVLIYQ